jgi:AcrR family transcriptional regulator
MSQLQTVSRHARQEQVREATRRAILDAALDLFVSDGYAQVSIRNIAAKVDYSPAAIYSYFPSKDDIFLALAEEGFRLLGARHLEQRPTESPLDDLAAAAWHFYEFSKQHPQYFALVFLDRRVPHIGRECERFAFMATIREGVLARVRRCIDEQLFPPDVDPLVAMRLLWAPVLGIAAMRLSERMSPGEDADTLVHESIRTTIAGLRFGSARSE